MPPTHPEPLSRGSMVIFVLFWIFWGIIWGLIAGYMIWG